MIGTLLTFVAVSAATAFVCTAVKEDEDERLLHQTLRLFGLILAGITAFGGVVELLTLWAG